MRLPYRSIRQHQDTEKNFTALEGAVSNTLDAVINVKDYGAKGNGTADDSAAIQAAVAACDALGGGEVFLPKGTYVLSTAISVPNFVSIRGTGQGSILMVNDDIYAINLNPANRTTFSQFAVGASTTQSAGGGFNFANSAINVALDNIWFLDNLFISLDISPTGATGGIHTFHKLRWNGVSDCNTAIRIGAGGQLVTDLYFSQCVGTAGTAADMSIWVSAHSNCDTLKMTQCLFIKGGWGLALGNTSQITNTKLIDVTVDTMNFYGIYAGYVREVAAVGCEISTCGQSGYPGLELSANSKGFRFVGGVIQNGADYGAVIRDGAIHTTIADSIVTDNNTADTASRDGISVAAGADYFKIDNNTVGNNVLLATGHQKYGIQVATGASDHYTITNNTLTGNETSDSVADNGTGSNKTVSGNIT